MRRENKYWISKASNISQEKVTIKEIIKGSNFDIDFSKPSILYYKKLSNELVKNEDRYQNFDVSIKF